MILYNALELVQKKSQDIGILIQNLKDTFGQIRTQPYSIKDISQTNVSRIESVMDKAIEYGSLFLL